MLLGASERLLEAPRAASLDSVRLSKSNFSSMSCVSNHADFSSTRVNFQHLGASGRPLERNLVAIKVARRHLGTLLSTMMVPRKA